VKFVVKWDHEVDAASPSEAAYLAFKEQKRMSAANASYEVASEFEGFSNVSIAHTAPMETLTDREREVARLVMAGACNSDIASALGITPRTVKAHVAHMFEKLGVSNRVVMATMLIRTLRSCTQ